MGGGGGGGSRVGGDGGRKSNFISSHPSRGKRGRARTNFFPEESAALYGILLSCL